MNQRRPPLTHGLDETNGGDRVHIITSSNVLEVGFRRGQPLTRVRTLVDYLDDYWTPKPGEAPGD